jgi:hypothetical protein
MARSRRRYYYLIYVGILVAYIYIVNVWKYMMIITTYYHTTYNNNILCFIYVYLLRESNGECHRMVSGYGPEKSNDKWKSFSQRSLLYYHVIVTYIGSYWVHIVIIYPLLLQLIEYSWQDCC